MKVDSPHFFSLVRDPFRKKDDKLYFIDEEQIAFYDPNAEKGINRVKRFFKKWPRFYEFIRVTLSPGFSVNPKLTPRKALRKVFSEKSLQDKIVLHLGSGNTILHPEVVNLDLYPFENVAIICDARRLPFKDASIDMIICESMLEHVPDPQAVVAEISRVVKPGGYLYIAVPFLYPFHASPSDYHRWTFPGLKEGFQDFEVAESGIRAGPAAALQGVLMHFFSLPLSFGIMPLYLFWVHIFMAILSPLKLLDLFFCLFPHSHEIAADIYFLGKKKRKDI